MSSGVCKFFHPIVSLGHHLAGPVYEHRPDRNLAGSRRLLGKV